MSDALAVSLKLDAADVIRHESVPFEVSVTNNSRESLPEVVNLDSKNLALQVVLESDAGHRSANQLSGAGRDGQSYHAPDLPRVTTLAPGDSMTLQGDLLEWFGVINPGQYRVKALYVGGAQPIESASHALHVHPAKPVAAAAPCVGERAMGAPLVNAWVHDAGGRRILLIQENSPSLPSNPRRCRRLSAAFGGQHLDAAQQPLPDLPAAHAVWNSGPAEIGVAAMALTHAGATALQTVKAPFPGQPLRSPLSTQEGDVWIPFTDPARGRYAALHAGNKGALAVDLKLGSLAPLDAYVNLWDYDANLYFAWSAKEHNEVRCGRLALRPAGEAFTPVLAHGFDAPVVWLDGYMQQAGDDTREPVLWVVRRKPGVFACCRFRAASKIWVSDALLLTAELPELKPIGSVVTAGKQLALLFEAPGGELYYGSTAANTITPVRELVRLEVKSSQFPGLLASDANGTAFWVHLRYLQPDHIAMVRLEPLKETDPMDQI